jgi:hypothetical protein
MDLAGRRYCFEEDFPSEDCMEMVVFKPFFEKGFGLHTGAFFLGTAELLWLESDPPEAQLHRPVHPSM